MITVKLKEGREKSVRNFHPWIYSGAIASIDGDKEPGLIARVLDHKNKFLAYGYYNLASQITVRLLEWNEDRIINDEWWYNKLEYAISLRKRYQDYDLTNSYRLVFSECDGLPGLIVDFYDGNLVLQSSTAGIDRVKSIIVDSLLKLLTPACIYERSDIESRKLENLEYKRGILTGQLNSTSIMMRRHFSTYLVDIDRGHKTGFYLDQADNHHTVASFALDRDVLDCFSYTGAFSVNVLKAGAKSTTLVDSSTDCLKAAEKNIKLNQIGIDRADYIQGNALEVLREFRKSGRKFELVILDPPKFAKNRSHLKKALSAYKDINMLGMELLQPGGYLATFSCSGLVDYETFKTVLFWASTDTRRRVQILQDLHQGHDHPRLATFPEGSYLKGFICRVD